MVLDYKLLERPWLGIHRPFLLHLHPDRNTIEILNLAI